MSNQNRTAESSPVDVIELPYAPPTPTIPIETFPLTDLVNRRSELELSAHQRLQFELIIWCTAGHGRHEVDFQTVDLPPGRIVHVRSGQVNRWMLDPPYEAQLILLRPLTGRPSARPGAHAIDLAAHDTRDLTNLIDLLTNPDRPSPLSVSTLDAARDLVVGLLALDQPDLVDDSPRAQLFAEFEQLLDGADPPPRTVDECAAQLGCSPRTLGRACEAVAGIAPKDLLDRAIALEAQRRLSLDRSTVSDVAEALGFTELSNFSRFFRRVTGQTPSTFIESVDGARAGHDARQ